MSIKLQGICRSNVVGTGNKMFQFYTSLIYAEKNNLFFDIKNTQFNTVIIDLKEINKGKEKKICDEGKRLGSGHFDCNDELIYYGEKNYVVTDFFQNANYLNNNSDIIFKYTKTRFHEMPKFNYSIKSDDFLCIVRLGDLKKKELIHPNFFYDIIKDNNFNNIYFLFYPGDDEDIKKYLSYFCEYKDRIKILKNENKNMDFYCVNFFKNIALTNSTYNWWSIFFANNLNNKKIYTSKNFGHTINNEKRRHVKNLGNIMNITSLKNTEFISPEELNSLRGNTAVPF
jgi:hypothetical protein